MAKVRRLSAFAVVVCIASRAHAQDAQADARKLLQRGTLHYDLTEYDLAIDDFKAAYELAPAPGLLFDIAQAYRLKGTTNCGDAARFYRNYLRLSPDAANHVEVEGRIVEMDACTKPPEVLVVKPEPPPPPPVTRSRGPRWIGFAIGTVGVAAVAVGLGLYLSADADYKTFSKTCTGGTCAPSLWQSSRAMETAGIISMIGGAAITIAGVLVVALWPTPSSIGISVGGRL